MPQCAPSVIVLALSVLVGAPANAQTPSAHAPTPAEAESFELDLPEWEPDPEDLPPELRPLDIERPTLPQDVAAEVAELEARIAELEETGLTAPTREEQDEALAQALEVAREVHAIRRAHQGRHGQGPRWNTNGPDAGEWFEIVEAARTVDRVTKVLAASDAQRQLIWQLIQTESRATAAIAGRDQESFVEHVDQLAILAVQGDLSADSYLKRPLSSHQAAAISIQGGLITVRPQLDRLLDATVDRLGTDHPSTASTVYNTGAAFVRQGDPFLGASYIRQAAVSFQRLRGMSDLNTVVVTMVYGGALAESGDPYTGGVCTRYALYSLRDLVGLRHPFTVDAAHNLAAVMLEADRPAEAEPYARFALQSRRAMYGEDHHLYFEAVATYSRMLFQMGQQNAGVQYARAGFESALESLGEEHRAVLALQSMLGVFLDEVGRSRDALPLLEDLFETRSRRLGPENPRTLFAANNMAAASVSAETDAVDVDRLALVVETISRVMGSDHPLAMSIQESFCRSLVQLDRTDEAIDLLADILARAERVYGPNHRLTIQAGYNYGSALAELGLIRIAVDRLTQALAVAEVMRAESGEASERAGRSQQLRIQSIATELALVRMARGDSSGAMNAIEQGRSRAALDLFARGDFGRPESGGDSSENETFRERYREARARVDAARQDELSAQSRVEAIRAFTDALRENQGLRERQAIPMQDELDGALDHLRATQQRMVEASAEMYAVLRQVAPIGDPMQVAQVQSLLDDGETVVQFIWSDHDVAAIIVSSRDVRAVRIAADRVQVDGLRSVIELLRAAVQRRGSPAVADAAVANAQDALLVPQLVDALAGAQRIITIPDGPLHRVPMELLLPDATIAYAPSATIAMRPRLASPAGGAAAGALVLGAPIFDGKAEGAREQVAFLDRAVDLQQAGASSMEQVLLYGGTLPPLPGTRREAEAIGALLPGATLLVGEAATAPNLRAAAMASPPRFLHLATHGMMGSVRRPYEASLALTQPDEPTLEDIGFLTLEEVMGEWLGALRGCELVTLSACDTGLGVAQGDTVMSLPLGFLAAGADSVLASLWKVDDLATALLMARFYANWLGETESAREIDGRHFDAGEPMPKLAALREAQSWLRALTAPERDRLVGADPDAIAQESSRGPSARRGRVVASNANDHPYAHPYYWAAFVLYGSAE
ncbi:MAG: CHAT domain-containing protein [Phycisphaerales bacterium]